MENRKLPSFQSGDPITFRVVEPDGSESESDGLVWSLAPHIPGVGKAWWVLVAGSSACVLVAQASRRHRCGRAPADGPWSARGGRFIDWGERYTETDARGRVGPGTGGREPGRAVAGRGTTHTARVEYEQFVTMCGGTA